MDKAKYSSILAALRESSEKTKGKNTWTAQKTFSAEDREKWIWMLEAIGQGQAPEFVIDTENKKSIQRLVKWFTRDSTMTDAPRKGFLVLGNVGTGKTVLFESLNIFAQKFSPMECKFSIQSCRKARKEFSKSGFLGIEKYSTKTVILNSMPKEYYYPSMMFDDLGSEKAEGKHYGSDLAVMAEIIQDRYELWQRFGTITHFTTNLTGEEIETVYGHRIKSRLSEMCNIVPMVGKDRRKK